MEVRRRRNHGASDPRGILALGQRGDPDLRVGRVPLDHRLQPFEKPLEKRVAAGQQDVVVHVFALVDVAIADRRLDLAVDAVHDGPVDVRDQRRIEQRFGASDAIYMLGFGEAKKINSTSLTHSAQSS